MFLTVTGPLENRLRRDFGDDWTTRYNPSLNDFNNHDNSGIQTFLIVAIIVLFSLAIIWICCSFCMRLCKSNTFQQPTQGQTSNQPRQIRGVSQSPLSTNDVTQHQNGNDLIHTTSNSASAPPDYNSVVLSVQTSDVYTTGYKHSCKTTFHISDDKPNYERTASLPSYEDAVTHESNVSSCVWQVLDCSK